MSRQKIYDLNFNVSRYYDTQNKHSRLQKEDISFSSRGEFIGEHHWNGGKEESEVLLEDLTKRNLDWSKIKTMYRYPNLSLSRDKVSLIKDKYGARVIRDKDSADICIISNKTIEKLIHSDLYYGGVWTVKTFNEKKMPELANVMTAEAYTSLADILSHLPDGAMIFGGDRYNSWNNSDEFMECPLTYFTENTNGYTWRSDTNHSGAMYIPTKHVATWDSFLDPSKIFVSDIYVNEVCSEDSIVLDWNQYEDLKKMLGATEDDKSVAMTIMANCKIEESKTALGLLFFHYGELMKGASTWNQVAFKTLRKQFDHYMIGGWNAAHTSTFSSLIKKLAEDNALTEEAMKHICELVFDRVLNSGCGFTKDECAFEMKLEDVRLTKHYKDKLVREDKTLSELVTMGDDLPF
jgi:hypothetical protein